MFLVFQSIFAWAAPVMDWIDLGFASLAEISREWVTIPWLSNLLADGIIAGLGSVLIFLPQIAILFFFIGLLERVGYMPRATVLMDRLFRPFGLDGRAFIPLSSSFACAIPGVMAAR